MTGSPDWLAYPQWIGANLFPGATMNLPPGLSTLYSGASPSFASLHIRVAPNAGYGTLNVTWFLDAAMTLQAGSDSFRCSAQFSMLLLYPVQAPFMLIQMDVLSVANMTGQSYLTGTNEQTISRRSRANPQLIAGFNVSVGASSQVNEIVGWLSPGNAHVHVEPGDALGKMDYFAQTINADSSFESTLAESKAPTAPFDLTFITGLEPVRLQAQNNDAAGPHAFTFSLLIGD